MNLNSLPEPPTSRHALPASGVRVRHTGLSRRAIGSLIRLAYLVAVAVMLCIVWRITDAFQRPALPQSRAQLDFKIVQKRYEKLKHLASREEVEDLLGPPSPEFVWEPEFSGIDMNVKFHPDRLAGDPSDQVWLKWTDPSNPRKWVAVHFDSGKKDAVLKNGF